MPKPYTEKLREKVIEILFDYYIDDKRKREAITEEIITQHIQFVEEIKKKAAESFHPYCGEPSCYQKLEQILSDLTNKK